MTYSPTRKPTTLLLGDSPLLPLLRELERIDLTLLRYYYRQKPLQDSFLPWLLSEDEVEARLLQPTGRPHWVTDHPLPALVAERQDVASDKLTTLIDRFELTDFERDTLLLGLLPQFDSRYFELFSVIQRGSPEPLPSFSLALALFCHTDGERRAQQASFFHQAPLIACQLLAIDKNKKNLTWSQTRFITDSSVYHFLLGHDYLAPTLTSWVEWLPPPAIPFFPDCLKEALAEVLLTEDNEPHPVVLLRGMPGSNRANAVAAIFASENRDTLMVDIDNGAEHDDRSLLSHMRSLLRETRMRAAGLVIRNLQSRLEKKTPLLDGLSGLFSQPGLRIVCLIEPYGPPAWLKKIPTLQLDMPTMTTEEKVQLLTHCLPAPGLPETDLISLSQRYTFHPQSLPLILREAALYQRQRDPQDLLQPGDLRNALNLRAQKDFGRLALRITPRRTFSDLLVSDELMKQLKEILAAIRYRESVLAKGFKDKVGYGIGISALFYGDSGTGKTMAAEVLAATLGVDLIKVDLSTVINKYIGETEKNLSQIFDLAEQDAGILFFDEADALFGKRSETKDAHDRHANIEVAYLLQRLENYPGLVILSTNNRSHLDSAFNRRFTFITRFTYPDEDLRIKMWQEIWPKNIKLSSEVDFNHLAQSAHITGANIRNIALLASFFAAEQGSQAVGQHHIDTAMTRELAKNGRLVL